ncbi:MAG: HAD-IIB family hydrolase [Mycoplasmoidaceae bacterium]
MQLKLVVSDADGTLLVFNETESDFLEYSISKNTITEINNLMEKKIHFSISTGRYCEDAYHIIKKAGIKTLEPLIIIGLNGAQIYNATKNIIIKDIFFKQYEINLIYDLYQNLILNDRNDIITVLACDNGTFKIIKRENENYIKVYKRFKRFEKKDKYLKIEIIEDFLDAGKIHKISFLYKNKLSNDQKELNKLKDFSNQLNYIISGDHSIEISPNNIDKGVGIDFLKDFFKIDYSQILVLGDSGNDLAMFSKVPHSATRCNAKEYVKKAAKKCFEGGASVFVAHAIKHYTNSQEGN